MTKLADDFASIRSFARKLFGSELEDESTMSNSPVSSQIPLPEATDYAKYFNALDEFDRMTIPVEATPESFAGFCTRCGKPSSGMPFHTCSVSQSHSTATEKPKEGISREFVEMEPLSKPDGPWARPSGRDRPNNWASYKNLGSHSPFIFSPRRIPHGNGRCFMADQAGRQVSQRASAG